MCTTSTRYDIPTNIREHSRSRCNEGEVLKLDGTCVKPQVSEYLYTFDPPSTKAPEVVRKGEIPDTKIDHNVVFLKTPDRPSTPPPIIIPPPQQQTLLYVVSKNNPDVVKPKVITPPSLPPSPPEVFYYNYDEGDQPHPLLTDDVKRIPGKSISVSNPPVKIQSNLLPDAERKSFKTPAPAVKSFNSLPPASARKPFNNLPQAPGPKSVKVLPPVSAPTSFNNFPPAPLDIRPPAPKLFEKQKESISLKPRFENKHSKPRTPVTSAKPKPQSAPARPPPLSAEPILSRLSEPNRFSSFSQFPELSSDNFKIPDLPEIPSPFSKQIPINPKRPEPHFKSTPKQTESVFRKNEVSLLTKPKSSARNRPNPLRSSPVGPPVFDSVRVKSHQNNRNEKERDNSRTNKLPKKSKIIVPENCKSVLSQFGIDPEAEHFVTNNARPVIFS